MAKMLRVQCCRDDGKYFTWINEGIEGKCQHERGPKRGITGMYYEVHEDCSLKDAPKKEEEGNEES